MHIDPSFLTGLFLTPFVCILLAAMAKPTPATLLSLLGFMSAALFNLPRLGQVFSWPDLYWESGYEVVLFRFVKLTTSDAVFYWSLPPIMWGSILLIPISLWALHKTQTKMEKHNPMQQRSGTPPSPSPQPRLGDF